MKKRILAGILSVALLVSNFTSAFAETVEISVIEKTNIDILLTTGNFNCNLNNFEQDIKEALERDGVDTSVTRIQAIDTSVTSSESMSASTIFNDWGRIGLTGKWSLSTAAGNNTAGSSQAIYNSENTAGITGFYSKESYDNKDMIIEFDVKSTDSDYDSIGVFLRFNLSGGTDESTANASKKATTYMYLEEIGSDTHVLPNGLYKINNQIMPKDSGYSTYVKNGTYTKLQAPLNTTNKLTKNSWRHYKFVVEKNNIKVYRGGSATQQGTLIIDYTDPNPIESGSFGFVNWSQPATFANFVASCKTERDFGEILTEPTWRSDAKHIIVNVDSNENSSLITNPEVLTRTFADDIYFVQWGNEANKTLSEEFIAKNDNKGTFIYGTKQDEYQDAVNSTVKYIESLLSFTNENAAQYVIIGRDSDINVRPEHLKTNAIDIEHPNGRWIVHHDYTFFDNNLRQSMQTENYTPDLMLNFDKPGAYNIYFDDALVKTVYAHRLPVADFTMSLTQDGLTLTSSSYDEDNNTDNGFGKGISKETWSYKEANASLWQEGKLETLEAGKTYIIKLEVEDFQGATSYITKYIGAGNPVSYFLTDKSQFNKYYDLNVTNASYDPEGYDITDFEWTLKKNKNVIATYTNENPNINFVSFGPGEYNLSLKVKNSQNVWSDNYTRGLTVIEDKTPPSVTIDPTYCDWKESQDIHIQIEDSDSGLNKWRYCYTQSQAAPNESDWGNWQTETDVTLTFDTDGEYYLHFEAYDNENNKLERTVGSYKITHPYTNEVTHHFGTFEKSDFYTYDWGKWYSPTNEFKLNINGFTFKENFNANYPVVGTTYDTTARIKQPSNQIEFDFYYEPKVYNVTYNYNLDDVDEVNNQNTYTVLDGFKLNNPSKEGYTFLGWYLNGESINSINFNKFNEFDSFEEFKSEMDNRISGNITLEARWRQENFEEGTNVFATIVSDYKVTIPKTIVLSGENKEASYYVKAEGDIAGIEIIKIVPDDVVYLKSINKETQTGIITQEKISWEYNDLGTTANGNIKANGITAGKWSGHFNFNITLENDEQNVNSEENVIYKIFHYPGGEITDLE